MSSPTVPISTSMGFSLLANSVKQLSEQSNESEESAKIEEEDADSAVDLDMDDLENDMEHRMSPVLVNGAREASQRAPSYAPPRAVPPRVTPPRVASPRVTPPRVVSSDPPRVQNGGDRDRNGGDRNGDQDSVLSSDSEDNGVDDELERKTLQELEEERMKREQLMNATKCAKIPEYRQVQEAVEERLAGMTDRDKQVRKMDLLRKFKDLRNRGYTDITMYNMGSSLEDMEIEYEYMTLTQRRKNSVKLYSNFMMNIVCGIEFLNDSYNPFDVRLGGWSEEIGSNIDDFEEVLGDIYEKYKGNGKQMEPEIKLAFMLCGSAATFHAMNTLFGKIAGMGSNENSRPATVVQPAPRAPQQSQPSQRQQSPQTQPPQRQQTPQTQPPQRQQPPQPVTAPVTQYNAAVDDEFRSTFPVLKSEQVRGVSREQMKKTIQAAQARVLSEHSQPAVSAPALLGGDPMLSTQTPISVQTPRNAPAVDPGQRQMRPPPVLVQPRQVQLRQVQSRPPESSEQPDTMERTDTERTDTERTDTFERSETIQSVSETAKDYGVRGDKYSTASSIQRKRVAAKKVPVMINM